MVEYFDVKKRIEDNPDCFIFIIIGGRGTGKTYSALNMMLEEKKKFVFIKRTIDDVNLLCAGNGKLGSKKNQYSADLSPFKPLNRDKHTNIQAFLIEKGLGAFYECDSENQPVGEPIGYVWALSAVIKFKGFDVSECDYMIFDEFIPQIGERVSSVEGERLLDLYITIARDREMRGRPTLKLICLANATRASNPTLDVLELVDRVVEMQMQDESIYKDLDKGIYLERLKAAESFLEVAEKMQIYKAMAGTKWADMALNNNFAFDDFSQVQKSNLKYMICRCSFSIKKQTYYIYSKEDGSFYVTRSASNLKGLKHYNLDKKGHAAAFYYDFVIDIKDALMRDKVTFDSYVSYERIINFKKYYDI